MSVNLWVFSEFTAVYIILSWAFYLPMRGGQVFNAPIYLLAICSYFSAYATKVWQWPYGLTFICSLGIGTLVSFITARAFAKTKGFALAIATIAAIFVVQAIIRNQAFLGGAGGLIGIPNIDNLLPITWTAVLIIGIMVYRIEQSRLGRALEALRENSDIIGAFGGINPVKLSVQIQTISGLMCGAAGAIYPFITGGIYPSSFGFSQLLYMWTILFVSGQTTMWGVLFFSPLLWGLTQIIPYTFSAYTDFIFGALLISILTLRPQGAIDRKLLRSIQQSRLVDIFRKRFQDYFTNN